MSAHEKRETMQRILFESAEVFNLKELESLGRKAGVVVQAVKDVIQSLVDDDLIEQEKIGSANFFWAFPSKASRSLQNKIEAAAAASEEEASKLATIEEQTAAALVGREPSAERTANLELLARLQAEEAELDKQLGFMRDNDPEVLKEYETLVGVARDGANRWTDNVWAFKSYMVKKKGIQGREFDKAMGLPEDFDYVDEQ